MWKSSFFIFSLANVSWLSGKSNERVSDRSWVRSHWEKSLLFFFCYFYLFKRFYSLQHYYFISLSTLFLFLIYLFSLSYNIFILFLVLLMSNIFILLFARRNILQKVSLEFLRNFFSVNVNFMEIPWKLYENSMETL